MNIDEMTKRIKSGEFDDSLEKFLQKEQKKNHEIKDFFKTKQFKSDFKDLKNYLKENKGFGTDGIYYLETDEEQEFANKAIKIFETVDMNVNNQMDDIDAVFPTMIISYKNVNMSLISGQGSFFKFWLKGE